MYQLDAGRAGHAHAWCPTHSGQIGHWIQVSATEPKLWN